MTSTHPDAITAETIGEQPEQHALAQQVVGLSAANASLQAELATMVQDRQEFLIHMGRRAREVAREHNWCSVASSLVRELGGIWPSDVFTFTITTTRTVSARLSEGCDRDPDDVSEDFIADSIRTEDDNMIFLDEDWVDVEVFDDLVRQVSNVRRSED